MIDLTPLDVRNKRGDFKKLMRGYDPQEVDIFLELVAERLEALTRENMALKERSGSLQEQVNSQSTREQAVQEALVTAQELRADIRDQSQREADHNLKEAETEGRRLIAEAEAEARTKMRNTERKIDQLADGIQDMERQRGRFLKDFRQLLEREMDVVEVEEDRSPLEERPIDLELGSRRSDEAGEGPSLFETQAAVSVPPVGEDTPDDALTATDITSLAPTPGVDLSAEVVPPADVPVDQLAAAYQQSVDADVPLLGEDGAPPPPLERAHDGLLLYLDSEDEEAGV